MAQMQREEAINRSMFSDDFKWDMCCDVLRSWRDQAHDNSSTDQPSVPLTLERTNNDMRSQIRQELPVVQRECVWQEGFAAFEWRA